jgi:hypothetical protein
MQPCIVITTRLSCRVQCSVYQNSQSRSRCPDDIIISRLFTSRLGELKTCKVSGPTMKRSNDCSKVNPLSYLYYLSNSWSCIYLFDLRPSSDILSYIASSFQIILRSTPASILSHLDFDQNRSFYQDIGQDTKDESNKFSQCSASHAEGGCSFSRNGTASTKFERNPLFAMNCDVKTCIYSCAS